MVLGVCVLMAGRCGVVYVIAASKAARSGARRGVVKGAMTTRKKTFEAGL